MIQKNAQLQKKENTVTKPMFNEVTDREKQISAIDAPANKNVPTGKAEPYIAPFVPEAKSGNVK